MPPLPDQIQQRPGHPRNCTWYVIMELKITPSGQTIVKPTALGPGANTDTKLLIYGLFQKGRVLAQDGVDLLQEASKVTVYSALASGSAVSAGGDDSGSVVEDGDMEELQPTTPTAVIASVNH